MSRLEKLEEIIQKTTSVLEVLGQICPPNPLRDEEKAILDEFFGNRQKNIDEAFSIFWEEIFEPSALSEPSIHAAHSVLAEPDALSEPSIHAAHSVLAEPDALYEPSTHAEPSVLPDSSKLAEPNIYSEPNPLATLSSLSELIEPDYERPDEKVCTFLDNMIDLMGYAQQLCDEPVMDDYQSSLSSINDELYSQMIKIFQSYYPIDFPRSTLKYFEKVITLWTNSKKALYDIGYLTAFESNMEKFGKPLSHEVDYSYFLNFMHNYVEALEIGWGLDEDLRIHEEHWCQYVYDKLKSGDIDAVWTDDIVNTYFQIIGAKNLDVKQSLSLPNIRKEFLEQESFSPDSINNAIHIMDEIKARYKDKKIDDATAIKDYANAYRLVYLKEYISGEQATEVSCSADYAQFIVMQLNSFRKFSKAAGIDANKLIYRAYSELITKETYRRVSEACGDKGDSTVISYKEPQMKKYTHTSGSVLPPSMVNIINYANIEPDGIINPLTLIDIEGHEIDHVVDKQKEAHNQQMDYESYMNYKTRLIKKCLWEKYGSNYLHLYYEVRARIGGDIAKINALKKFPLDFDETADKQLLIEKSDLKCLYGIALRNKLFSSSGTLDSLVDICDSLFSNGIDAVNMSSQEKLQKDMLLFEYREDGTRKSYTEIIREQEEEMKGGTLTPQIGPQTMEDRLVFRIRVMMQIAAAKGEEESLINELNDFLSRNRDALLDYPSVREVFPNGVVPTKEEAGKMCEAILSADNPDYEKAELVYGFFDMEREIQKRKFFNEATDHLSQRTPTNHHNKSGIRKPNNINNTTTLSVNAIEDIVGDNPDIE